MSTASIGSRLKPQFTEFSDAVSKGLSRRQRKSVHQMLWFAKTLAFIQASRSHRPALSLMQIGLCRDTPHF